MYLPTMCSTRMVVVIPPAILYALQGCSVLPDKLNTKQLEFYILAVVGIKWNENSLVTGRVCKDE